MGDDQTSIVAAVGSPPPPPPDKKKNNKLEILLAKHIDMKPPEIYLLSIQEEEEEEVNITTLGGGSQFPQISCHGLILTLLDSYPEKLAIWNPTTTSKDDDITPIPQSSVRRRRKKDEIVHMYGFGFDPSSIDYKVIRFIDYRSSHNFQFCHFVVEMFSLKTNSWKRIKYPFGVVCSAKYPESVSRAACPSWSVNTCICINGFCYWKGSAILDGRFVIIPFDLATDNFASAFIPGPPSDTFNLSDFMLAEFGGSLAVIAYQTKPFEFELWVWNNGESSWSLRGSWAIGGHYSPQGFLENDKLFLHNKKTKEVVLFDCAKQKLKNLGFYAELLTIFPSLCTVRSSDDEEIIK